MSKETVTVYWAVHASKDRQTYVNMLWEKPVPLITTLPQGYAGDHGNYRACSALINMSKNIYTVRHPVTTQVTCLGTPETPTLEFDLDVWTVRSPALKNCYSMNYNFGYLFFAENPLEIRVTPAYLHDTSDSKTGFVSSGSFDIGQWFRPVNLTYILWEGKSELKLTEGDPVFYIEFLTDKSITLKHFDCTDELMSIASQVANSNSFMRFKPLTYRYKRFMESNRNKQVLKLIKDNLLE
jgi:hypothetical protein